MPGFRLVDPARAAMRLDSASVHVWRLPYASHQGRQAFTALVAHYLGCDWRDVAFRDGEHGRPELAAPSSCLSVNWSHSGHHALLALARDLPVLGVDFEAIRPRPRALELARRFFAPRETAALSALPRDQLEPAFLRLWTAKEAVLKALGQGLRFGLHRVVFELRDKRPVPCDFVPEAGAAGRWRLHRLDDAAGYASVAWRDGTRGVEWFELPAELSPTLPVISSAT